MGKRVRLKRYRPACAAWGLRTASGARKYLTTRERSAFMAAAARHGPEVRTLCLMLVYVGCRLSEALAIRAADIEIELGLVVIRSLKKRRGGVVREVPLPPSLLRLLRMSHGAAFTADERDARLWPWARTQGWTHVKAVMRAAGLSGIGATPKGLRHTFGVHAALSGAPLPLVQRWLGHADIATTAIYMGVMGEEERQAARKMWRS